MILSFTIPDTQVQRYVDAMCAAYGYQATIVDPLGLQPTIPNPETKGQFAKRMMAVLLVNTVKDLETRIAATTAAQTITALSIT